MGASYERAKCAQDITYVAPLRVGSCLEQSEAPVPLSLRIHSPTRCCSGAIGEGSVIHVLFDDLKVLHVVCSLETPQGRALSRMRII